MRLKLVAGLYSAVMLVISTSSFAETPKPISSAKAMAWQCAACHGVNGQEFLESMPSLAGMSIEQFTRAMHAFRDGKRPTVIMDRVARGFTDAEIDAMAIWFNAQPHKQWEETSLEEVWQAQKKAEEQASLGDK